MIEEVCGIGCWQLVTVRWMGGCEPEWFFVVKEVASIRYGLGVVGGAWFRDNIGAQGWERGEYFFLAGSLGGMFAFGCTVQTSLRSRCA